MNLIIQGELCDLNRYLKSVNANRYAGANIKRTETERVAWECKIQKIEPISKFPAIIEFQWYSKNNRMDIDNIGFAKKFILDGLVMAKVIPNDSRKYVQGFKDLFFIDKLNPRICIDIM